MCSNGTGLRLDVLDARAPCHPCPGKLRMAGVGPQEHGRRLVRFGSGSGWRMGFRETLPFRIPSRSESAGRGTANPPTGGPPQPSDVWVRVRARVRPHTACLDIAAEGFEPRLAGIQGPACGTVSRTGGARAPTVKKLCGVAPRHWLGTPRAGLGLALWQCWGWGRLALVAMRCAILSNERPASDCGLG